MPFIILAPSFKQANTTRIVVNSDQIQYITKMEETASYHAGSILTFGQDHDIYVTQSVPEILNLIKGKQ